MIYKNCSNICQRQLSLNYFNEQNPFSITVELQELNFFVFCVVFQLLELFCFEFLHALATGNDDVISTAELCHDVRNRPSNLVLVVEFLILLSGIQRNLILLELMLSG